jgi:hypothetical protein
VQIFDVCTNAALRTARARAGGIRRGALVPVERDGQAAIAFRDEPEVRRFTQAEADEKEDGYRKSKESAKKQAGMTAGRGSVLI